jgi:hypothetical protein
MVANSVNIPASGSFAPLGLLIASSPITLTKYYIYQDNVPMISATVQIHATGGSYLQNITVNNDVVTVGSLNPQMPLNSGDIVFAQASSSTNSSFTATVFTILLLP